MHSAALLQCWRQIGRVWSAASSPSGTPVLKGDYVSSLMVACNEIEQNGAATHAMIVNPYGYYHHMMGKNGLQEDLARNSTLIHPHITSCWLAGNSKDTCTHLLT